MAYSKLEQRVFEMAKPIIEDRQCYIYDVEYSKEGKSRCLRIFADKRDGGISLDDCEAVNRCLGAALDKEDPIKENYILEVSSPGIERQLRQPWHFEEYTGEMVEIGFYKAVNGAKQLLGKLKSFENGEMTVEVDGADMSIMQSDTAYVKLHFDF